MRYLKTFFTSLAVILIFTAATRLAFSCYELRKIPREQLANAVFQTEAGSIGRSLAQGKGFSSPFERESGPTAILPPVYPLLVAGVFRLVGIDSAASFYVLVLLNIAFATLTVIPIFEIGRRIGGRHVGAIAGWLWALFPNGIVIPFEWIWETSLSALLVSLLLWATLKLRDSARWLDWIAYGLLWGLALMTNPALGAALPMLLLWPAWRTKPQHHASLIGPTLVLLTIIVCCLPWTIRNFIVFHRFLPLRSGLSFELYIGNNENYDARQFVWPPRVSYERELIRYLHTDEMSFMDEERRKALAFIDSHRSIFLKLSARRFLEFWTGTPAPLQTWRSRDSLSDRSLILCNFLAPLLALAGAAVLLLRRRCGTLSLLAFPLFFPIIYYVTHASLRYRHPIDPVIFLLAGVAVSAISPATRLAVATSDNAQLSR